MPDSIVLSKTNPLIEQLTEITINLNGDECQAQLREVFDKCGYTAGRVYDEILTKSKAYAYEGENWYWNSEKKLAAALSKSVRTIQRAIHFLVKKGYLTIKRLFVSEGNQSNFYQPDKFKRNKPLEKKRGSQPAFSFRATKLSACLIYNRIIKLLSYDNNFYNSDIYLARQEEVPEDKTPRIIFDRIRRWNKVFKNAQVPFKYAKSLWNRFGDFLKDGKQWSDYLKKLTSIAWFQSPSFNLRMDSVCAVGFRERVMAGEFDKKWVKPKKREEALMAGLENDSQSSSAPAKNGPLDLKIITPQQAEDKINRLDDPEEIKQIRYRLVKKIGEAQYDAWFHSHKIFEKNGEIFVEADNQFTVDKWEQLFGNFIKCSAGYLCKLEIKKISKEKEINPMISPLEITPNEDYDEFSDFKGEDEFPDWLR